MHHPVFTQVGMFCWVQTLLMLDSVRVCVHLVLQSAEDPSPAGHVYLQLHHISKRSQTHNITRKALPADARRRVRKIYKKLCKQCWCVAFAAAADEPCAGAAHEGAKRALPNHNRDCPDSMRPAKQRT
jgi:hypothetical protein